MKDVEIPRTRREIICTRFLVQEMPKSEKRGCHLNRKLGPEKLHANTRTSKQGGPSATGTP